MIGQGIRKVKPALFRLLTQQPLTSGQFMTACGTAFAVAPGYLVTAAHILHQRTDPAEPLMSAFFVVPGLAPATAARIRADVIGEDRVRDLGLLRVDVAATPHVVPGLLQSAIAVGTPCGSLGFPLLSIGKDGALESAHMRFQQSVISAHLAPGEPEAFEGYETDNLMMPGSSGCPGFVETGEVFGVHTEGLGVTQDHFLPLADELRPLREFLKDVPALRIPIARWVASGEVRAFLQKSGVSGGV